MKKKAVFIGKNEVISIEYFLEYYVNLRNIKKVEYKGEKELTHDVLSKYLRENGSFNPKRISFDEIKKDEYLRGRYLFVKDNYCKIIPYLNPVLSLDNIFNTLEKNPEKLTKIREELIKIIELEGITCRDQVTYYDDVIVPKRKTKFRSSGVYDSKRHKTKNSRHQT